MYTLHIQTGTVTRDDGIEVAPCQSSEDPLFIEYINWINSGNEPRIVDYPTPVVPQEVTMRQAQRALLEAGLLDEIEQVINQSDRATQIDWHKGQSVRRDWPAIAKVQSLLGMSDRQIDDLFIYAESL